MFEGKASDGVYVEALERGSVSLARFAFEACSIGCSLAHGGCHPCVTRAPRRPVMRTHRPPQGALRTKQAPCEDAARDRRRSPWLSPARRPASSRALLGLGRGHHGPR